MLLLVHEILRPRQSHCFSHLLQLNSVFTQDVFTELWIQLIGNITAPVDAPEPIISLRYRG